MSPFHLTIVKYFTQFLIFWFANALFFRAHAFEGTLGEDRDCSAEKETPKNERGKEAGRGQASEREESLPSPASPRKMLSPPRTFTQSSGKFRRNF